MTATTQETGSGTDLAGRWIVDQAHSSVEFQVKHAMIATVKGRFSTFSGAIEVSEAGELSIEGTVDVASIDTRESGRDEHLRSADFFSAEEFPTISFRTLSPAKLGDDSPLVAELEIRGVKREVPFVVSIEGHGRDHRDNERLAVSASAAIDRRDFGLTWNSLLEAGGVLVGETVKILVETSSVKEA